MVATKHIRPSPPARPGSWNPAGTSDTYAIERLLRQAAEFGLRAPELGLVLGERAASLAETAGSDELWVRAEGLVVSARVRLGLRADTVGRAVAALRAAEDLGEIELGARLRTDLAVCARSVGAPLTGLAALRPVLTTAGLTGAGKAAALCQLVGCLSQFGRKPELDRAFVEADKLCGDDDSLDGDDRLLARAYLRAGMAAHRRRHADILGAGDAARTGLGLLEQLDDPGRDGGVVRVRLMLHLVCSLLDRGDMENALEIAQPILDEPTRAAAIAPLGWLRMAVATRILLPSGGVEAAAGMLRDAVYSTERHGLNALTSRLWAELATVEQRLGRPTEAIECLHQTRAAEHLYARSRRQAMGLLTGEFGNGGHAAVDLDQILGVAPRAGSGAWASAEQPASRELRLASVRGEAPAEQDAATRESGAAAGNTADRPRHASGKRARVVEESDQTAVEPKRTTGKRAKPVDTPAYDAASAADQPARTGDKAAQVSDDLPDVPLAPAPADEPAHRFSLTFEPTSPKPDGGRREAGNSTKLGAAARGATSDDDGRTASGARAASASHDRAHRANTADATSQGAEAGTNAVDGAVLHASAKESDGAVARHATTGGSERGPESSDSAETAAPRAALSDSKRDDHAESSGSAGVRGRHGARRGISAADNSGAEPSTSVGAKAPDAGRRGASANKPKTRHDSEHGSVAARSVLDRLGISTGAGGGGRRRASDAEPGRRRAAGEEPETETARLFGTEPETGTTAGTQATTRPTAAGHTAEDSGAAGNMADSGTARMADSGGAGHTADSGMAGHAAVSDTAARPADSGGAGHTAEADAAAGTAAGSPGARDAATDTSGSSDDAGTKARSTDDGGTEAQNVDDAGTKARSTDDAGTEAQDVDDAGTKARSTDDAGTKARNADGARGKARSADGAGTTAESMSGKRRADRKAQPGLDLSRLDDDDSTGQARVEPPGAADGEPDAGAVANDEASADGGVVDGASADGGVVDGAPADGGVETDAADVSGEGRGVKVNENWLPKLRLPPSLEPFEDLAEDVAPAKSETQFTSKPNIEDDGLEPFGAEQSRSFLDEDLPEDAGLADLLARALAEHQAGTTSAAALVKRLGSGDGTKRTVNGHSRNGEAPGNGRHRTDG